MMRKKKFYSYISLFLSILLFKKFFFKKTREIKFHNDTPSYSEKFSLSHATLVGFKKHHIPIQKLNAKINISGYVGPHVLRNLCINIMNEEDCDYYVESVFKLYGERKKGMHVCLHVPNFYIRYQLFA